MIEKDIEYFRNKIKINDGIVKEARKSGDINAEELVADLDEESKRLENVLKELNKYRMISDKLAEKLELLIISIYHKEEILSINTNKVKEYYENNKSIKAELIRECKEELVCFLRERGRR